MYAKVLSILTLAILLGCAVAEMEAATARTVKLDVFGASSPWWVAVQPEDDNGATVKVEIKDSSKSSTFLPMQANPGWGYYTLTSTKSQGFTAPLTFRLTSSGGDTISVTVSAIESATIDSRAQYGGRTTQAPTQKATAAPTQKATQPPRNTQAPATQAPTQKASTPAPTQKASTPAPTQKASTPAPTQKASTPAPSTQAPPRPTVAPTTKATSPPSSGNSGDLCSVSATSSEPLKILVPLYTYPGASWDSVVSAASKVKIIAIINPNSGPLPTVDSSYSTYMTKLKNAGVEIVGYVHTTYGQRALADVKADIDTYASKWPLVQGIFLDEASNLAKDIAYYTQVYNHVMSKSGYKHNILNPGVLPDQGYMSISTNIVIFEDAGANLARASSFSSWVKCAPNASQKAGYKYKFSAIVHTTASSSVSSYVNTLKNAGVGLVYFTDGAGGCCTYNTLASYFATEATNVAAAN